MRMTQKSINLRGDPEGLVGQVPLADGYSSSSSDDLPISELIICILLISARGLLAQEQGNQGKNSSVHQINRKSWKLPVRPCFLIS